MISKLKHSLRTGFSFGVTSGVITTLGLITGLHSGTHSKKVIIGGVLTIAIADAFSDALGIHVSEESENKHSSIEIWESTLATFISKFIATITFCVPLLVLPLTTAIIVSIAWGFFVIGIFSFYIAKEQNVASWKVVIEHMLVALLVVILTHYVGEWIGSVFG